MRDSAIDLQYIAHRPSIYFFGETQCRSGAILRNFQDIGKVNFRGVFCLDQAYIEVCQVTGAIIQAARGEADDDIGKLFLWLNVEEAVATTHLHLLAYLLDCVAARSAVAHNFRSCQESRFGPETKTARL